MAVGDEHLGHSLTGCKVLDMSRPKPKEAAVKLCSPTWGGGPGETPTAQGDLAFRRGDRNQPPYTKASEGDRIRGSQENEVLVDR